MTINSSSSDLTNGELAGIASRLRSRMDQLGFNETQLAMRCSSHDFAHNDSRPVLSRERIAKILMNNQPRIGKGAARLVRAVEIDILADILDVSPDWLKGEAQTTRSMYWDVGNDPKFAKQVGHLLAYHEEETGETFMWGESLLCSLTPPEFAHQYHINYFSEFERVGLVEQKRILVETYDRVGCERRKRLFEMPTQRRFALIQMIFQSELEMIVSGTGYYKGIHRSLRRKCLQEVSDIVADGSLKVSLIVARDSDVAHVKHFLRDFDRFGVNGEKFSIWSHHSGRLSWTEDEKVVRRHRRVLDELYNHSLFREPQDVRALLSDFVKQMERSR